MESERATNDDGVHPSSDDRMRQKDLRVARKAITAAVGYLACIILALFFNNAYHNQPTTVITTENLPAWEYIGTSGTFQVDTYIRKVPGTKLFAFKGAVVLDSHIADVLRSYGDVKTTTDWVDLLKIMETTTVSGKAATEANGEKKNGLLGGLFGKLKNITSRTMSSSAPAGNNILLEHVYQQHLTDLVYQFYQLPWPVAPRDFVFQRDIRFYPNELSVTAQYVSTEDSRYPTITPQNQTIVKGNRIPGNTIRAESPFTNWLFQDLTSYCAALQPNTGTGNGGARTSRRTKDSNPHRESYVHDARAHTVAVCRELLDRSATASTASASQTPTGTPHKQAAPGASADSGGSGSSARRTYVEIEALVDNKGSLPAWFVNYVQRSWPSKTLSAFAAAVDKAHRSHRRSNGSGGSGSSYTGALAVVEKW